MLCGLFYVRSAHSHPNCENPVDISFNKTLRFDTLEKSAPASVKSSMQSRSNSGGFYYQSGLSESNKVDEIQKW